LAAVVLCAAPSDARAVTFNVTGTNIGGDTLSGTLEADVADQRQRSESSGVGSRAGRRRSADDGQ
jgi:hypothetical protein